LIQSESGFLSVTGTPDDPAKAGCSIADISAGMYAYSGILAALLQRGRTGLGSRVEISMLESMAEWMSYPLYYAYQGAEPPPRAGAAHATIYPYGPFPAGDGNSVMLGLQNEREWEAFCAVVMRQPGLATDPRFCTGAQRNANREALRAIIVGHFSALTAPEVVTRLDAAQIANARVNAMHDVWEHPQLRARERWVEIDTPRGRVPALLPPGAPEAGTARMDPVPELGEHTDRILAELGWSPDAIAALRRDGAI